MRTLQEELAKILGARPYRMVLSAPLAPDGASRATLQPIDRVAIQQEPTGQSGRAGSEDIADAWQVERIVGAQAFHQNVPSAQLPALLAEMLEREFTQLTALSPGREWRLKRTRKGRVLASSSPRAGGEPEKPAPAAATQAQAGSDPCKTHAAAAHDRVKRYLLPATPGAPLAPLVDMGVLTPDGRVAKAMHDKYRQVNRFVELVDHELSRWPGQALRVVDFGCGKSYLTFVLYHYLTALRGLRVEMLGLDLKADVVENCNRLALKYGYEGLRFEVGDIAERSLAGSVDMVVTLHACDTATDHALAKAVAWGAQFIFSVPCCQHELNAQMQGGPLPILTRYGIVQERTAALMTDAIRANLLMASGYKAQLLEFVDLAHTPKNLLIRARKASIPPAHARRALAEVDALCEAFSLAPTLRRLLDEEKAENECG